jgi:hypothetical protein
MSGSVGDHRPRDAEHAVLYRVIHENLGLLPRDDPAAGVTRWLSALCGFRQLGLCAAYAPKLRVHDVAEVVDERLELKSHVRQSSEISPARSRRRAV